MGYTEKATAYYISLLELSTSKAGKEAYLSWWKKGCALLGTVEYVNWWESEELSQSQETLTQVLGDADIWRAWLIEEKRKEDKYTGPVPVEEVVDPECHVTGQWLRPLLFVSRSPAALLEATFRVHLPEQYRRLPLPALFHCPNLSLPGSRVATSLELVCRSLYDRVDKQTSVGVLQTLIHSIYHRDDKATSRFVKGLLKDSKHRNNTVYWLLYAHFCPDATAVLGKLLKSGALPPFDTLILENRHPQQPLTQSPTTLLNWEQDILKPQSRTCPMAGGEMVNKICRSYRARLRTEQLTDSYLLDHVTRLRDHVTADHVTFRNYLVDVFVLLERIISYEKECSVPDTTRARKVGMLAVEHFPEVEEFWNFLTQHTALTPNLWDRFLKSGEEMMWYRRICAECDKQQNYPTINLTHRIYSLSLSALQKYPNSMLLWEQYITNMKKIDEKSLKSALIRAVKENPSHKNLYILGIEHCPQEEVESLYQLIEEKQIRIRTLIEEMIMFTNPGY